MTKDKVIKSVRAMCDELEAAHAEQLRKLTEEHKAQLAEVKAAHATELRLIKASLSSARVRINKITRLRDQAVGRAREYRSYANKYQRELIELKKEARNARV